MVMSRPLASDQLLSRRCISLSEAIPSEQLYFLDQRRRMLLNPFVRYACITGFTVSCSLL